MGCWGWVPPGHHWSRDSLTASLVRFLCGTVNDFVAEVGRAYKRATENKQEAELMARKVGLGVVGGCWGRACHRGAQAPGVLRRVWDSEALGVPRVPRKLGAQVLRVPGTSVANPNTQDFQVSIWCPGTQGVEGCPSTWGTRGSMGCPNIQDFQALGALRDAQHLGYLGKHVASRRLGTRAKHGMLKQLGTQANMGCPEQHGIWGAHPLGFLCLGVPGRGLSAWPPHSAPC